MPEPTPTPNLTPQFCFNERALREFLRLSRSSIDDSISTHLNSLLTPSLSNPFQPTTTITFPTNSSFHRTLPPSTYHPFLYHTLFPTWSSRTAILEYCASVSTSPDPNDPTLPLRELESDAQRSRIVDERLDPYSARYFPREARTERLREVLRQEGGVERIVRRRVWGVVRERCRGVDEDEGEEGGYGGFYGGMGKGKEGWERAMDKWREEVEREERRVGR